MIDLLTSFDEATLLQRLLAHSAGTDALRDVLGLPDHPGRYATFPGVDLCQFGARGDVDLLVIGGGGAATTTAVECKRVRLRPEDRLRPSPSVSYHKSC